MITDTETRLAEILKNADPPQTLPAPSAPYEVAAVFLEQKHLTPAGERTLYSWRDTWMVWQGSHWQELTQTALDTLLYGFTARATYVSAKGDAVKWSPTPKKISDLRGALTSLCALPDTVEAPCWLDGRESGTVIAVANGLLDIESRELNAHSPLFFNVSAVPFNYDAKAPTPVQWFKFLDSIWPPADEETPPPAQDLLQEWFGYVLSGRTDLQEMLLMQGPTRGGRGTISRVLTALLGKENVAGLRLDDLGETFGMAPLIGKSLAIAGDERFGGKNMNVVVSLLLMITGEDMIAVNRKNRARWTGRLPTRIMVCSNELQKLSDASATIVERFLPLRMTKSFLGQEDLGLLDRLLGELPGILIWALDGLQFLTENGKFTVDPEAEDLTAQMKALASPIHTYVEENCGLGEELTTSVTALYHDHCSWRRTNGHKVIADNTFGVALRAAFPQITRKRSPRLPDGSRPWLYYGIQLKKPHDALLGNNVLAYRPRTETS
jgi:putative DNA primase/helicase